MPKRLAAVFALVCAAFAPSTHAASTLETAVGHIETGLASYYASKFDGRRTASGDTFRNALLMAAHPTFPFGTVALVTNLTLGYSVIVKIADRGPAPYQRRKGVIIDLSQSAAKELNMLAAGRAQVSVKVLEWGKGYAVGKLKEAASYLELRPTQQVFGVFEPRPVQLDEGDKIVLADPLEHQEGR